MVYLIIGTICFSLSFGLIKAQLVSLPTEFVVFARLLIATLIFLPFISDFKPKQHLKAIGIGIIQFGIMYLCFIKAFQYLQGNEIAILTTTTPIFVAIFSALLGEKFKPIYILCIILSVIGAGIIVWQNVSFHMLIKGIILMESSNCAFALGQVLWKKYIGITNENLIAIAYLGATLFVLPFTLINGTFSSLHLTYLQVLSILSLLLRDKSSVLSFPPAKSKICSFAIAHNGGIERLHKAENSAGAGVATQLIPEFPSLFHTLLTHIRDISTHLRFGYRLTTTRLCLRVFAL